MHTRSVTTMQLCRNMPHAYSNTRLFGDFPKYWQEDAFSMILSSHAKKRRYENTMALHQVMKMFETSRNICENWENQPKINLKIMKTTHTHFKIPNFLKAKTIPFVLYAGYFYYLSGFVLNSFWNLFSRSQNTKERQWHQVAQCWRITHALHVKAS